MSWKMIPNPVSYSDFVPIKPTKIHMTTHDRLRRKEASSHRCIISAPLTVCKSRAWCHDLTVWFFFSFNECRTDRVWRDMVNFHAPLNAAASHLAYPLSPFTWVTDRSLEVHLKKKRTAGLGRHQLCCVWAGEARRRCQKKKVWNNDPPFL